MSRLVLLADITLDNGGTPETHYLASEGYTTAPGDTPANTNYLGRLTGQVSYDRSVGTVFWGNNSSASLGALEIINADGGLDSWVDMSVRDQPVTLRLGVAGDAYSTFVVVAQAIAEKLEIKSETVLRLVLRDKGALLDKSLLTNKYAVGVPNTLLENTPEPFALGEVYHVPAVVYDAPNLIYQIADDYPVLEITEVRDRGVVLAKGSKWNYEWITSFGAVGIKLVDNPDGQITVSFKMKEDPDYAVDGSWGADVINNGNFANWTGGSPDNWTETNTGDGDVSNSGSAAKFAFTTGASNSVYMESDAVLEPGRRYRLTYDITAVAATSYFAIKNSGVGGALSGIVLAVVPATAQVAYFVALGNKFGLGNYNTAFGCSATLDNIVLEALDGPPIDRLEDWVNYLAVTRGGLSSSEVNSQSIVDMGQSVETENLLLQSGEFATAPWSGDSDTLTKTEIGIDGLLSAWFAEDASATLSRGEQQNILIPADLKTICHSGYILLDSDTSRYPMVGGLLSGGSTLYGLFHLNTTNGVMTPRAGFVGAGVTGSAETKTEKGRVWLRWKVLFPNDGVRNVARAFLVPAQATVPGTFNAAATGSVVACGWQIEHDRSEPGPYVPTTTVSAKTTPYTLGFASKTQVTIKAVLEATMQSLGGWHYIDRLGLLTVGRLEAATGPDLTLNTINILSDVTRRTDVAKGLSTALGAQKTWGKLNVDSVAGSVDLVDREALSHDFALVKTGATAVDDIYAHARDACAIPTLLQTAADAQAEINRWTALYSVPRYFYDLDAVLNPDDAIKLEPGNTANLIVDRFGLDAGKNLLVVEVRGDFLSGVVKLVLWG